MARTRPIAPSAAAAPNPESQIGNTGTSESEQAAERMSQSSRRNNDGWGRSENFNS